MGLPGELKKSKVIAEYASGAALTSPAKEYVYSGSQLLATLAGTSVTYHHPDHLSNRAETNSSGTVTRTYGHFPFGETWYETGTADKWKFTSYERDTGESNLDYASFRYYGSGTGRFGSPDLLAGNLPNPQSLNRYAYSLSDPVNLSDPLGLMYKTCQLMRTCVANAPPGTPGDGGAGGSVVNTPEQPGPDGGGGGGIGNAKTKKNSICDNIPAAGKTVPVQTSFGQLRFQFNGQGTLTGVGIQLTGDSGFQGPGLGVPSNTFAGFTIIPPGTVQFGFNNPVDIGSGFSQVYFQNATFSDGKFTAATGALAPFGVPLGSPSGNSSLLLPALNGDLPSTSSVSSQAQQFGEFLKSIANLLNSLVSRNNIFGN